MARLSGSDRGLHQSNASAFDRYSPDSRVINAIVRRCGLPRDQVSSCMGSWAADVIGWPPHASGTCCFTLIEPHFAARRRDGLQDDLVDVQPFLRLRRVRGGSANAADELAGAATVLRIAVERRPGPKQMGDCPASARRGALASIAAPVGRWFASMTAAMSWWCPMCLAGKIKKAHPCPCVRLKTSHAVGHCRPGDGGDPIVASASDDRGTANDCRRR